MFIGSADRSTATVARLASLPSGQAGTVATLRHMRAAVADAIRSPKQIIRTQALELVRNLPPRKYGLEMARLHGFVRDEIRYVRDVHGIETVQTPEKTLELAQGDCDDKSTLLAALLKSIGHPSRFVAMGFKGGPFSHVLVESKLGPKWVALETIIPKPAGWYPSDVTSRYVLNV